MTDFKSMKRLALFFITSAFCFAFGSHAFAVAVTASQGALNNTRAITQNCSKTEDPNVKRRCAFAAQRAAARAEEKKAKKKQEMISTLGAGLGAAGAIMGMKKKSKKGKSSTSSSSSTSKTFSTADSDDDFEVTVTSSNDKKDKDSNGKYKCSNSIDAKNINQSCKKGDRNVKFDLTNKCMCVGTHCFDIKTVDLKSNSVELSQEYVIKRNDKLGGGRISFSPVNINNRSVRIYNDKDSKTKNRGLHLPDEAYDMLEEAIKNLASNSSPLSMKVCKGTVKPKIAIKTSPRPPVGRQAKKVASIKVKSAPKYAARKLTKRMDHAVKVRKQFAPLEEVDTID